MEEDKNTTNEVPASGTETVETTAAPEITVEQIKEVSARIEELNRMRGELEAKKREFDIHMKDLENIRTVYGEASKQFDAKRDVIKFTDNEMKGLEDNIGKRSFKRSELKPYLDGGISLAEAVEKARVLALENDGIVVVCGSLYLASECLNRLGEQNNEQ